MIFSEKISGYMEAALDKNENRAGAAERMRKQQSGWEWKLRRRGVVWADMRERSGGMKKIRRNVWWAVAGILLMGSLAGCGNTYERIEVPQSGQRQSAGEVKQGQTITVGDQSAKKENDTAAPSAETASDSTSQQEGEPSGDQQPSSDPSSEAFSGQAEDSAGGAQAVVGNPAADAASFPFANVAGWEFYFSSGAGAWYTAMDIHADGTFDGHYQDVDMGDMGEGYSNGTLYYCDFYGQFTEPEKVNETTYVFQIESIRYPYGTGEEINSEEQVRYIYTEAYGLDGAQDLYLYLPESRVADLPEDYVNWVHWDVQGDTLGFYGLYNETMGEGFSSNLYQEYASVYDRIAAEIAATEEQAAELNAELQKAATQSDMNAISGELYQVWDDTLNVIWGIMKTNLNPDIMDSLTVEERAWITEKEAAVKAAGEEYKGGSMQSLAMNSKAAKMTRDRVYKLAEYAKFD